ncbi:MAG: hypothetical protein ABSF11_10625 [Methylocella sp.]|jgi:hypothetical protein
MPNDPDTLPKIDLDAGSKPPRGVDAPSQLHVFVGDPPRELSIFTGVAAPEFEAGGQDRVEVRVRLGAMATEGFGWTAQAALASISNDDSDFTFATDSASVDLDPSDSVLRLKIAIAAIGGSSILHRISYTVHVLSDPIQAKITGQISWSKSFGGPTYLVTGERKPMFRVDIGQTVAIPAPEHGVAGAQFVPQASVSLSGR